MLRLLDSLNQRGKVGHFRWLTKRQVDQITWRQLTTLRHPADHKKTIDIQKTEKPQTFQSPQSLDLCYKAYPSGTPCVAKPRHYRILALIANVRLEWKWPAITNRWGSVSHQMAVPVPSVSYWVLNHHNLFYQIRNALAFNQDMCSHLALFLWLLPFH
jgi:hypothetical protein